jgi:hypothetical protein
MATGPQIASQAVPESSEPESSLSLRLHAWAVWNSVRIAITEEVRMHTGINFEKEWGCEKSDPENSHPEVESGESMRVVYAMSMKSRDYLS